LKKSNVHEHADEIRAKGRKMIIWIALAMDISTRLWMAGTVCQHRDRVLIDRLFRQVRACCSLVHSLLVCTDGFAASPKSIMRAFREKVKKKSGMLNELETMSVSSSLEETKK
jgi:hypothetical protein